MNFDAIIDRSGTRALKWDDPLNEPGKPDILPLWVADMDFAAPTEVTRALEDRAAHPIYGYTREPKDYAETVASWYRRRYGAEIQAGDVCLAPGLVPSLGIAVRSLTEPGAGVVVLTPVYYPFYDIIQSNDRALIAVPLGQDGDLRYVIDFSAIDRSLEAAAEAGHRAQAIMFCSPHNPGGRVWSKAELDELSAFCKERGIAIICDEIHADFSLGSTPFTSIADRAGSEEPRIVTLGAPNKTFNIAGLHLSHFACAQKETLARVKRGIAAAGFSQPNIFSIEAAYAAYRSGEPWLEELIAYLRGNIDYLVDFAETRLPGLTAIRPEGGYLVWVNASELIRELGLSNDAELVRLLAEEGRVRLNPGSKFGAEGSGYVRVNVACPQSLLIEGLERIERWVSARKKGA